MGDVTPYLKKLASQHRKKPKLEASLTAVVQPLADAAEIMVDLPLQFDLDTAVGTQLDTDGTWIGLSRNLTTPLVGVYFSFDEAGIGFDEGTWKGPFDPSTGLVSLPDENYRVMLRAKVLNNQWDGSVEKAYAIWDALFEGTGYVVFIVDHGDLTMSLGLFATNPDAVTLALFTGGYMDIKPEGVRITSYLTQSGPGPMFAFDLDTDSFAGFDEGLWATVTVP